MDSHTSADIKSYSRKLVDSGEKFKFAIPHIYTLLSVKSLGEEDTRRQPPIQKDKWINAWLMRYRFRLKIRQPMFPLHQSEISKVEEQSIDLKLSLQMLLHDATRFVEHWTDVNIKFDDKRSFRAFESLLESSGLDWHKNNVSECVQECDLESIAQPNHAVRTCDLESIAQPSHAVRTHPDWVMANEYYGRSLALMRLLLKIRKSDSFKPDKQNQASMLMSFLGHLIMIQQEQRVVVKKISDQLEQLRCLASGRISTGTIVNPHDSLYIISRESTWLLKKLKDYPLASPSFIEESGKIVDTLVEFIPKFKESKESNILIQRFKNRIKRLQEDGVGKGTVIENLLGCLEHVCNVLMTDYVEAKGVLLDFPWFSTICGQGSPLGCGQGSPLGCITLWRILFESSAAGLGKYYEAVVELEANKGGAVLPIVGDIGLLVSRWEKVLLSFVDMHKTVAMITYMLGDAFTTGGAAMNSLHDEAPSQSKNDEEMEMVSDFPWDEHKVPDIMMRFDDPSMWGQKVRDVSSFPMWGPCYGSSS